MKKIISDFYKQQPFIYKIFLYLVTTFLIVYFFPKGGKFKYDFQKGKPWQYETLLAPFDIAIEKDAEVLANERQEIRDNLNPYFDFDEQKLGTIENEFQQNLRGAFPDSLYTRRERARIQRFANRLFDQLFQYGSISNNELLYGKKINMIRGKSVVEVPYDSIIKATNLKSRVESAIGQQPFDSDKFYSLFFGVFDTTLSPNEAYTQQELQDQLSRIPLTRGTVIEGMRIIGTGEVVEGEKLAILNSLRKQYESEIWTESNYNWIVLGYSVLVALALLMLFLFIKKYRQEIYGNNTKVTFIFFNVLAMIILTTFVVRYNAQYVYVVPLCILPLILKAFFDARLGLFAHVLTILLLGFIVPNSFEFIFLQIIAGIVTILTISEAYKRANLFISVGQITLIYIAGYFAFFIIHEGNIADIKWENFGFFILNGLLLLASFPLIYIYEKTFGLISDVSLLELSDTNSKLLKELSDKAPGTFHHSLQVANLAEAAANQIGANAMLVRVGALYHDIGKMSNPTYFTENQITSLNPHNELSPIESAQIIIDHVIEGIRIARRNNLPDRVIDFIRTHHGTSLVYYFYKKQEEFAEQVNEKDFRYPGPLPFSKETAILMMCDAVEAASKSLKEPTAKLIDSFVERIVEGQLSQGQFINANITFKEIESIKKVLKRKLTNIYHLRVEYPE